MKVKSIPGKGRGIFAQKRYSKGEKLFVHEILEIPPGEAKAIENTFLNSYAFMMEGVYFIALGIASLVNHSPTPNLTYGFRKKSRQIEFFALRAIGKGEELNIDYEWDAYPWESPAHVK